MDYLFTRHNYPMETNGFFDVVPNWGSGAAESSNPDHTEAQKVAEPRNKSAVGHVSQSNVMLETRRGGVSVWVWVYKRVVCVA